MRNIQRQAELRFEAPAGTRTHRGFLGITVHAKAGEQALWWSHERRRWTDEPQGRSGSHAPCRTVKAFRRHLRRHAADLAGRTVVLVSRWEGHDVASAEEG